MASLALGGGGGAWIRRDSAYACIASVWVGALAGVGRRLMTALGGKGGVVAAATAVEAEMGGGVVEETPAAGNLAGVDSVVGARVEEGVDEAGPAVLAAAAAADDGLAEAGRHAEVLAVDERADGMGATGLDVAVEPVVVVVPAVAAKDGDVRAFHPRLPSRQFPAECHCSERVAAQPCRT